MDWRRLLLRVQVTLSSSSENTVSAPTPKIGEEMERSIKGDFVRLIPSPENKRKRKRKTTTKTKTKKKKPSSTPKTASIVEDLKPSSTPESTPKTLPLPDDLVLSIVARVPRLYYPTLSLVSKGFRSLVASPDLYKARSRLGLTESCLYVCFQSESFSSWFTLARIPDKKAKKYSSPYVLTRVAKPPDSPLRVNFSTLVAVGSDIYNIGVLSKILLEPTSRVSILDCRSHTWREGPSLPVELSSLSANVLDQKIYVAGCYRDGDFQRNSLEVLDIKTQTWDLEPIPCNELYRTRSTCTDGKLHVVNFDDEVLAFDSKEGRWDVVEPPRVADIQLLDSYCEIDNVLYFVSDDGALRWYDTKERSWKDLMGLVGLPKLPCGSCVRLAGYGGKMVVLWERNYGHHLHFGKIIWCAEIALERRKSCEIWGKVEWFDDVLQVSTRSTFVKVLAPTL